MLRVEWIDDPERWAELQDSWDLTLSQSNRPCIFASWDFLQTSWKYFARAYGSQLAVLRFYDVTGDVGFAPLRINNYRRCGLPRRRLSQLAQWESDRPGFIVKSGRDDDCASAFWNALEDRVDAWDQLDLFELSPGEPLVRQALIRCRKPSGFRLASEHLPPSVFLVFDQDWDSLLEGVELSLRRDVDRLTTNLERQGHCELEICEDPEDMAKALEHFVALEQRSRNGDDDQGIGKDHRHLQFYRELLESHESSW